MPTTQGLEVLSGLHTVHNLPAAALVEEAIRHQEGFLADNGALVVHTGRFTGRSPQDKYIVYEPSVASEIEWGAVNHPLSEESFHRLLNRMIAHLRSQTVYSQNLWAGADAHYTLPLFVVTTHAWQSLFIRQLLLRSEQPPLMQREDPFTVLCAPDCFAVPEEDGTRSETFIAIHFGQRLVLIGGTAYAGEIKKAVFTIMNYLLPQKGVFPMHCAANAGKGDSALFFGLSGTGKTTLSALGDRPLIGDDEHGWSDDGVFNIEGGCYAKCIHLSRDSEPHIWDAIRFGTVLENVELEKDTRRPDFDSDRYTENTRAAYPIEFIPQAVVSGKGDHPKNLCFLTADAFGVLPPISRLSLGQACYHFLNGYTAKVAGTERGLGREPQAVFSTCFAEPFLPLSPLRYLAMFREKLARHAATVWLVNTGWIEGPYGVGRRIPLECTQALIEAALSGALENVGYQTEPFFGLSVPLQAPKVPAGLLLPQRNWPSRKNYEEMARALVQRFRENFSRYAVAFPHDFPIEAL
ncbi:ATP-dependent phosphoenolpyruvate carboxykinase [Chthonomonas calidirosea]|uniref:Phosphoenolpyruvate carboxykinase (ATP) n=1 Tax=Chthonomonas calidirosea (strain DSM 23976 / ICMP 18418 / T49) TaxID=1303518 RepID=S0EVB1_CHTCT|nr:phosphoenolpyruvate carboxykinase (ATP) [Chthonomonas calidirosea]CCW35683.1 phosphoenolpyruvate carboxykinase (ATP) [Chthonomonas calidirosea T49]CEK19543.1 ATP-dependent phosphoenolpyruvate carboxykinase [Chthonomonas calidirosea]